jgi:hydroxymethylbilane synthase
MTNVIRLGTRASALARWQAEWVAAQLRNLGVEVALTPIATTGDREPGSLQTIGGQGVFTKEIQRALLDGQIDLAVHSLKDLPTVAVPGLCLAAVPRRGPAGDVLVLGSGDREQGTEARGQHQQKSPNLQISKSPNPSSPVPQTPSHAPCPLFPVPWSPQAIVGTGSLRRKAQLLHVWPDLQFKDIRGNVETRLRKLEQGECDALVLAEAGLRRLGLERHIDRVFPFDIMLPAIGQGALGLETRADDRTARLIAEKLDDPPTHIAVLAERAMLSALEGGCLAPIAAFGRVEDGRLTLAGRVVGRDGRKKLDAAESIPIDFQGDCPDFCVQGDCPDFCVSKNGTVPFARQVPIGSGGDDGPRMAAAALGRRVAESLLDQGAAQLIWECRS